MISKLQLDHHPDTDKGGTMVVLQWTQDDIYTPCRYQFWCSELNTNQNTNVCHYYILNSMHGHPKAYFFHAGVTIWSTRAVNSLSSSLWSICFWSIQIYMVRTCLSTLMNVTARFTQSLLWMFNFHIVYQCKFSGHISSLNTDYTRACLGLGVSLPQPGIQISRSN